MGEGEGEEVGEEEEDSKLSDLLSGYCTAVFTSHCNIRFSCTLIKTMSQTQLASLHASSPTPIIARQLGEGLCSY